ncbi:hypothetical protein NDU88_001135 [Pleurodeles waltl]|uniref:NAD(P)-binding domain-containing protein n=1 Tax=Pleurodeles waltl TaxID=8319 RepID=A0AAV7VYJ5_PLEWA|nr:hypothetical protein NDU88_001135 [Pleurodeles waltl]
MLRLLLEKQVEVKAIYLIWGLRRTTTGGNKYRRQRHSVPIEEPVLYIHMTSSMRQEKQKNPFFKQHSPLPLETIQRLSKHANMKLAVLGASGRTGQYLVTQALQQGHEVTALVRNVGKIPLKHENLKVVEANIFSADSLSEHFQGQDVIVSCLGFSPKLFSSISGYTDSMSAIVKAMREAKVDRIIVITSWYTEPNSRQNSPIILRVFLLPVYRTVLNNIYEMENFLEKECSDLNWTAVRPPDLQSMPATDKEFLTHEGYFVPGDSGPPARNIVSRGDLARFMLLQLESNEWTRKAVSICTK